MKKFIALFALVLLLVMLLAGCTCGPCERMHDDWHDDDDDDDDGGDGWDGQDGGDGWDGHDGGDGWDGQDGGDGWDGHDGGDGQDGHDGGDGWDGHDGGDGMDGHDGGDGGDGMDGHDGGDGGDGMDGHDGGDGMDGGDGQDGGDGGDGGDGQDGMDGEDGGDEDPKPHIEPYFHIYINNTQNVTWMVNYTFTGIDNNYTLSGSHTLHPGQTVMLMSSNFFPNGTYDYKITRDVPGVPITQDLGRIGIGVDSYVSLRMYEKGEYIYTEISSSNYP